MWGSSKHIMLFSFEVDQYCDNWFGIKRRVECKLLLDINLNKGSCSYCPVRGVADCTIFIFNALYIKMYLQLI